MASLARGVLRVAARSAPQSRSPWGAVCSAAGATRATQYSLGSSALQRALAAAAPRLQWRSLSTGPTQQATQWSPDPEITAQEAKKAAEKDMEMRVSYDAMPDEYPAHAQPTGGDPISSADGFRKRLIYRSKQRGWLEVDLIMGSFATKFVPTMTDDELRQYESILNAETIDIFNYVSGKDEVPPALDTPMMARLQEFAKSSPIGKADPEAYAAAKKVMSN